MNARAQVRAFRRGHHLRCVNSSTLTRALEEQGYTVVEFNGICDTEDVAALIEALGLEECAAHCKCFAYQDERCRLVFLHADLNEEERTIVLAHEAGHIWNGHMSKNCVFGEDVLQEREANEFAHYLLRDRNGRKTRSRRLLLLCALLAVLLLATGAVWKRQHDAAVYTDKLYRTRAGTRYHLRECVSIRDRRDVRRLTRKEYESGEYQPCELCLPDQER